MRALSYAVPWGTTPLNTNILKIFTSKFKTKKTGFANKLFGLEKLQVTRFFFGFGKKTGCNSYCRLLCRVCKKHYLLLPTCPINDTAAIGLEKLNLKVVFITQPNQHQLATDLVQFPGCFGRTHKIISALHDRCWNVTYFLDVVKNMTITSQESAVYEVMAVTAMAALVNIVSLRGGATGMATVAMAIALLACYGH